jgi:hypothetical protein
LPELKLVAPDPVDTFQLAHSRVTVTMRRHRTGKDHIEAMNATIGEGYNARHAYRRYLLYLACTLITSWDATRPGDEGEQEPIPVSPQTLGAIEDEEDYEQILNEADQRAFLGKTTKNEKEVSETSSTPSSPETSPISPPSESSLA